MNSSLRRSRPALAATMLMALSALAPVYRTGAQNVLTNGDFSEGGAGWTIYDMGSDLTETTPLVEFLEGEDCPSNGSGQCAVVTGTVTGYAGVFLWQEVTLVAGTPYTVEGQFRMLVDTVFNYMGLLLLSTEVPRPNVDYQAWSDVLFAFDWWRGCAGVGVDGPFSVYACGGRMEPTFVPPGVPGEEITYYFGFKTGANRGPQTFAVSVDDFRVEAPAEAFAVAEFATEPAGRALPGERVTFDASTSSSTGTILSYEWDLGDGTTESGVSVYHTYEAAGRFTVRLVVTADDGSVGTIERVFTIWDGVGTLERPLEVPRTAAAPEIDGVREALWDHAQRVSIATRANDAWPDGPADLSAEARLLWDDAKLYVFFDVADDTLINDSGNSWQDDAPELYLDGDNSKGFERYDNGDDGQWEFGWGSDFVTGNGSTRSRGTTFSYVTREDASGYTVELEMPWSNLGSMPRLGDTIGLELMVNDDDTGGDARDHKLSWFAPEGEDEAWHWAHVFGNAVLVDATAIAAEPKAAAPGHFGIRSIFPNPFNASATVALSLPQAGTYDVRVFDVVGRLVLRYAMEATARGQEHFPLLLHHSASGIYFVHVQNRASGRSTVAKAFLVN